MTIAIAFFNNKGGVGKTTVAYHLAFMLARLGYRVLAADLDPQANLTASFFDEDDLEVLWDGDRPVTVLAAVDPLLRGIGDINDVAPSPVADRLWVLPGHIGLSRFEDGLSEAWPKCFSGDEAALRRMSAFHRILQSTATGVQADVVLVDVGPNLGAINRSALLAADGLLVPLAADLFSLQGLRNLGPTVRDWRRRWRDLALSEAPADLSFPLPSAELTALGYVVLQHAVRLDRPVKAYERWFDRIGPEYGRSILDRDLDAETATEHHQLASLRNYRSLMPLAQDARKPMFDLRPADGALGSTGRLVDTCREEFEALATRVATAARLSEPAT